MEGKIARAKDITMQLYDQAKKNLLVQCLKQSQVNKSCSQTEIRETTCIDYWEMRSHAQSVYPTQYTPLMRTARVKQKEEADTKIIAREQ